MKQKIFIIFLNVFLLVGSNSNYNYINDCRKRWPKSHSIICAAYIPIINISPYTKYLNHRKLLDNIPFDSFLAKASNEIINFLLINSILLVYSWYINNCLKRFKNLITYIVFSTKSWNGEKWCTVGFKASSFVNISAIVPWELRK